MKRFRGRGTAQCRFRFSEGHTLDVKLPGPNGQCHVVLSTDYLDNARGERMPVGLVMDFLDVPAEDLDGASASMDSVMAVLVPVLAFAANVSFDDPKVVMVYDADEASNEHPLRFNVVPLVDDAEITGSRVMPVDYGLAILDRFMRHPDAVRISRALISYNEALTHWASGRELRSVLSLWVALENLDKLAVKACLAAGATREQLIDEWCDLFTVRQCPDCGNRLPPYDSDIEAAARRMVLLEGDDVTYKIAAKISNGYEHGFMDFPSMHRKSKECRDALAKHVRRFVVDILGLDDAVRDQALDNPYGKPQRVDGRDQFMVFTLVGPASNLAPEGSDHPVITAEFRTDAAVLHDDGSVDATLTTRLNFKLGEGIETQGGGFGASDRVSKGSLEKLVVEEADGTVRDLTQDFTNDGDPG